MPFLLLSVLLHIGILIIIPHAKLQKKMAPRLIPVDVIKLPQPAKIQEKESGIRSQKSEEKKKPLPPLPIESNPALKQEKRELLPKEEREIEKKPEARGQEAEGNKEALPIAPPLKEERPVTLFPPKERLSELSKEYEKQMPVAEAGKNLSFDSSEPRYVSYLEGMKAKIYHEWAYPYPAAREGQSGRLFVRFTILKDGTLEEVALIKSSGYPMLDDAALSAIRLAAPFYRFPKGFGSLERIAINASFEYILESSAIRNRQ
ncbi:MAG: energy transducer TonB [Deltaproteobacteria bacterium]|nr:energy transducer TonB [Deltaproteobacteria bacterium]